MVAEVCRRDPDDVKASSAYMTAKAPVQETDGVPVKWKGAAPMVSLQRSKDDATAMTGLPVEMVFWS